MVYNFSAIQLLNFLLPVSCGLCNATTGSRLPLCQPCQDELPIIVNACRNCALPLISAEVCGRCQQKRPSCDAVHALLLYQEPVNFLVQQFKFNRKLEYGRLFSAMMAEKMASLDERPDLLIPVPLHSSRLRTRGYNQAWELARQLSKIADIHASHRICQRIKKTPMQTGLKASERRRNLKKAFAITEEVKGLHICIIDDVMTTGSTLEAIASVLKSAGAGRVTGMVIARVVM